MGESSPVPFRNVLIFRVLRFCSGLGLGHIFRPGSICLPADCQFSKSLGHRIQMELEGPALQKDAGKTFSVACKVILHKLATLDCSGMRFCVADTSESKSIYPYLAGWTHLEGRFSASRAKFVMLKRTLPLADEHIGNPP